MRAIRVSSFGGPEVLKLIGDVPVPTVSKGQVRFWVRCSYNPIPLLHTLLDLIYIDYVWEKV